MVVQSLKGKKIGILVKLRWNSFNFTRIQSFL